MNRTFSDAARRALALALCAVMLLGLFPGAALAQDDWQSLNVTLSWIGADGNPVQVQAMPVAWSQNQSFWAQVPADAPLNGLVVSAAHPNHDYSFLYGDEAGNISFWDAGTELTDGMGLMIRAFEYETLADVFYLYVSTTAFAPQEPQQPQQPHVASVEVIHRDTDGYVLYQQTVTVTQGQPQTFDAPRYDGYDLESSGSCTVDVNENGYPTMDRVEFVYRKQAAPAVVWVRHVGDDDTLFSETQESLAPGSEKTYTAMAFPGYTCMDATPITVTVDANGVANREHVEFYYARDKAVADVTVQHMSRDSEQPLYTETKRVTEGEPVACYPQQFEGYTSESGEPVYVEVRADGSLSQNPVVFYYTRNLMEADIQVRHVNTQGEILHEETVRVAEDAPRTLTPGDYEGYVAANDGSVTVTVGSDGVPSQQVVMFTYLRKVNVTAQHMGRDGALLYTEPVTVVEGIPAAVMAREIEGYTPESNEPVYVETRSDGSVTPDSVVIYYTRNLRTVDVVVRHVNTQGAVLYEETIPMTEGETKTIMPQSFDQYTPKTPDGVTVSVDEQGNVSQNPVTLTYLRSVVVSVMHMGRDDRLLLEETVPVTEDNPASVTAHAFEGYTPENSDAVAVEVYGDGSISANPVVLYYTRDLKSADVVVQHVNSLNGVLYEEVVRIMENETKTFAPLDFPGYEPQSDGSVSVTVDGEGRPDRGVVVINYLRVADVVVYHLNTDNETLYEESVRVVENVPFTVTAQSFSDYLPVTENGLTITIDGQGTIEPDPAVIYYYKVETPAPTAEPTAEPTEEPTAEPTAEPTEELTAEPTAEPTEEPTAEPMVELTEEPTVEPTDEPTALPTDIPTPVPTPVPTEIPAIPTEYVPASIVIRYVDQQTGADLMERSVKQLEEGGNLVIAGTLPEGWELVGSDRELVYVENGYADKSEVIFVCGRKAVPTDIPTAVPTSAPEWGTVIIHYQNEKGKAIAKDQAQTLSANRTHVIEPDRTLVSDDYDFESVAAQSVLIGADGNANPSEITFTFALKAIAPGEIIDRFGVTNANKVIMRSKPGKDGDSLTRIEKANTYVWLIREEINAKNETWYQVRYQNEEGYLKSEFVDLLSVAESNERQEALVAGGATAVPHFAEPTAEPTLSPTEIPTVEPTEAPTEIPTAEPTEVPTENPTAEPTEAPTEIPTAEPTEVPTEIPTAEPTEAPTEIPTEAPTEVPVQYRGYALTRGDVPVRDGVTANQAGTITTLAQDTLVYVEGQLATPQGEVWSRITTLDQIAGYVTDINLRHIDEKEASFYLELWAQQHPAATEEPAETAVPERVEGWFYTVGDNVPMRNIASDRSVLLYLLPRATAVYVSDQIYNTNDGWPWHLVQYQGQWGYIRSDMLRLMTEAELLEYIEGSATAAPTPEATPAPYDKNSLSSYGYIYAANSGRVNVRQQPSTHAGVVKELRNYALCLITGTEVVDGTTWYRITYNNEDRGYVRGDLIKQMTLEELDDFLNSERYKEGVRNNTAPSATATVGQFTTQEQQNANVWVDPNNGLNITYATWTPMRTPAPLATEQMATPAPIGTLMPWNTDTPAPTEIPVPLATVDMNGGESGSGGGSYVWIFLLILLILVGGGAYVYVVQRENKRKAAQRAAQRRAAQAAQQRAANGQQPRTVAYPQQGVSTGNPQNPRTPIAPVNSVNPQQSVRTSAVDSKETPRYSSDAAQYQRPAAQQRPIAPAPSAESKAAQSAGKESEVPHRQRRVDRMQKQNDGQDTSLDS